MIRQPTLRWVRAAGIVLAAMALLWLAVPVPDPLFADGYGTVVLDREGEILHTFLAEDQQWRLPLGDEEISPKVVAAVLAFEDRRFHHHPGVDPIAVARAVVTRLDRTAIPSGASTITMQVARLMRPKPRTVPNKLLEMAQALKLESLHSKEEILRLYLGHAPYGGNLVGISAASLHYFGRPPSRLTWAEAATLAVLPNAPARITPARNRDRLRERRDNLLRRLAHRGHLDEAGLREAVAEDLPPGSVAPRPGLHRTWPGDWPPPTPEPGSPPPSHVRFRRVSRLWPRGTIAGWPGEASTTWRSWPPTWKPARSSPRWDHRTSSTTSTAARSTGSTPRDPPARS
jgi:membrane carboxypeptidase/penicillin-binding protein PbpC